jgi:hypothetical protein
MNMERRNKSEADKFDETEAKRRFEAALRGAFVTAPKPMKDIPRKRSEIKRKPRTKR